MKPLLVQPFPPPAPQAVAPEVSINILIVDDEPKNLMVLESVLDDPSYRLVRAESGDQALLALMEEEFAVLVLDIRMPGMTGLELAQLIKERKKTARVPIIFLTAYYNEDQHVLEGYGSGAVDYMNKPVNAAVLRSKVAVFAELHRKRREVELANHALVAEVNERRRAEALLRDLNETLDQRVTERSQALNASDARLRLATDAVGLGIWAWRPDENTVFWENEWLYETLGVTRGDKALTMDRFSAEFVHQEDIQRFDQSVAATVERGERFSFEGRFRRSDGTFRWIEFLGQAVPEVPGDTLNILGTSRDITGLKRMEVQLRDADRRKDEFLATLAHELRNPLAPVRNAVRVLHMKGPATPEMIWVRDVIDRQVQAMTRLIDDLMDLSRISQGKIELRRDRVELAAVLQAAIEASRPLIDECGHELRVTLPDEPFLLDADSTRLAQVFMNLLNNAAKYMDKGGRIDLSVRRQGEEVVVTVKDAGIGIAGEGLATVFEMFAQVQTALSRSRGGLGIGLSLSRQLAEMHGGTIEAHSGGLGHGSEFAVRLPLVAILSPAQERDEGLARDAQHASDAPLRILIADDNEDAAVSLALVLEMMGNQVFTVHDGAAAVLAVGEFDPAVAVLDIGMPKLNGYQACRAIRALPQGPAMVLIALTGWGQSTDKHQAQEAGFDFHLVKPVEPLALVQKISELVALRKAVPSPERPRN